MNNKKALLLLFFLMQGICFVCFAQTNIGICGGGDLKPFELPPPRPDSDPSALVRILSYWSSDPNEIVGLEGYDALDSEDTLRWVSVTQTLAYTVYFENDAELATAAASRVSIKVPLHEKLNYATLGIGSFSFGNHIFAVEGSPSSYQTRIDLRDSLGIYLDVVAGLDIVHNEVFWIFQSIDPATGLPPTDINMGFLPINDSLHSGEGFVTFTIKPNTDQCVTGDTVSATASIVFDVNEAISTNTWVNTIDAVAPTSTFNIVDNGSMDHLTVTFSGEDDEDGCGIKQFRLYYSQNDEAYQLYGVYPVGDTAQIPMESDVEYQFFVLAEDNVGNCEPMKAQPEYNIGTNFINVAAVSFPEDAGEVTGGGTFSMHDTVTLSATAMEGYHFRQWMKQGAVVSTSEQYEIIAEEDQSYTAYFERNAYTLQTLAAEGSTITITDLNGNEIPSGSTVLHAEKLVVQTNHEQCYSLIGGLVNGIAFASGDTLTVTGNTIISTQTLSLFNTGDTTAFACDSFDWYEHTSLTQSGNYIHTLTNVSGCDSVVTLHLTIVAGDSAEFSESVCDSYTWGDVTYTESGDYTLASTSATGCDFVVTLHLIVNHSTTGDTTVVVNDSFTWHGITFMQSGDYTFTLSNAAGCDSVVTLHLIVNHSTFGDTTAIACDNFTWYGITYTQSGDYTYTLTNTAGIDSVVTLHLTINNSTISDTTASSCESFTWYGTAYSESGDYTSYLTNINGCDSVVTLHLTVADAPTLQAISGETAICINQFATYYYDASDPDYHYRWFKDNALWAENVPQVILHEMNEGDVLLTMQVADEQLGCLSDTSLYVQVVNRIAPDTTEIRRMGNTNMLVCRPVSSEYGEVHYRWGYTDLNTSNEVTMQGDHNYCLFDFGIDTLNFRYWVETYLNNSIGVGCDNRSYYGYSYITSISDYDANTVTAYISNSRIILYVNALSPDLISATVYDVNGKMLLTRDYGVSDEVSDIIPAAFSPGVYFLKVNVGNLLYSFKLLKM